MTTIIVVAVLLVVGIVALQRWLSRRQSAGPQPETFDGEIYRVGAAHVAERSASAPRATVICMHGFVENLKYFTRYYSDPGVQLILVNSGDYHLPIKNPRYRSADWATPPQAPLGTIRYDAEVLVQALEQLPKSNVIRVHGHSRGGAVTLEAAALRPDLFENVEVILEAPVLPQARPRKGLSELERWFMPLFFALWRKSPINDRNRRIFEPLDDPRKRELIAELPFNGKHAATLVNNQRDIEAWMSSRDYGLYRNVARGTVLVPDTDRVLDRHSMRASAERSEGRFEVVVVENCSHFVLQDRPEVLPRLLPIAEVPETENTAR